MRSPLLLAATLSLAACTSFAPPPPPAAPSTPCNLNAPPRVQLFGGIKHPGALAYEPGLTVFAAIERAGGFQGEEVQTRSLRILRCGRAVGPFPAPAASGAATDLPLERGDVLDVPVAAF
jgi:protein involved in polysaccharide export with SLBB domain